MSDILDLANSIATCKEDIRQAIINKKVECDNTVPFKQYADKVSQIRLASDYSDVVSVDAINYTGKDIKKGDKVWIVPNEIIENSTRYSYNDYSSKASAISRDGKTIVYDTYIINTENNSETSGFVPLVYISCLRWDYDDIKGSSDSYLYKFNMSLFVNRGYIDDTFLCHNIYCYKKDSKFYIQNRKTGNTVEIGTADYAYPCAYDDKHNILYTSLSEDNTQAYLIDWNAKTVTWHHDLINYTEYPRNPKNILDLTSDCSFIFYTFNGFNNNVYIAKIDENGYSTKNFNYNELNEDFSKIFKNNNVYMNYNRIDDMLYVYDNNHNLIKSYKYNKNNKKFILINSIKPKNTTYLYDTCANGSGDGLILVGSGEYFKVENKTKQYKATNTLTMTNTENALSGIAEENAANNQLFKVGVALGPLTQLTVTSSTENIEITVE